MEEAQARRAAEALFTEHKTGVTFKAFDASYGLASMSDAYDIQDHYVALLRVGSGEPIGYKVGLTSKAMQAFCGIDHPIGGVVLAKRELRSGATVHRMPASAATPAAVAPYVDAVCTAFEVVDDRAADYGKLDVKSLVADNSWNAGMVLSDFTSSWPDLEAVLGKATQDGALVGEGHGRDILGHPFNSVAWINAQLASRGGALRKGQIVMTGSVMKTVFPTEPANYRFEFEGLGAVEVKVA
jgi:2-keto-4-pentenoate hydratase